VKSLETEIVTHLERLCVEIGPRPVGSRANQAAADYVQGVFQASGLETQAQEFPCLSWEQRDIHLELDGETLDAAANVFSRSCDVTAPAVAMGTLAELENAALAGRIGIMHGDLTRSGLSARNGIYFPERDQKIMRTLEEKKPDALITVNPRVGCFERLIVDADFPIPSATVPAEAGLTLLRHSAPTLRLKIDARRAPGQARNVIARKAGTRPEHVVLCAHFDTKLGTPGAFDNGAGVAILLALAQSLAQSLAHRDLATGIEWVAFNGEEMGGLGDVEYWRQKEGQAGQILAAINVDGAGQYLGANSITMLGGAQAFQDQVSQVSGKYPGVVWVDPWYESNHSAFYWRGIPSIPIGSSGGANVTHLPIDTVEWISPTRLNEVASLVTDVVESLQERSCDWCREPKAKR
jgi:Iap family predicted aminopeptidase